MENGSGFLLCFIGRPGPYPTREDGALQILIKDFV